MTDLKYKTYHRNLLEKLLKERAHLLTGEILDIGSKNRRYDYLFRGKITAIDLIANPDQRVDYGNIENRLDFPDQSFDSILCLEVFEYLENYSNAISEIYRLLKPSGRAIVSIPFMYHEHQDKMRFTKSFIATKFNQFSSVQIEKIGNAYTVIWDILRKKWWLGKKGWSAKIIWNLLLRPLYFLIKPHEKIEDQYYSGVFIVLRK